MEVIFTMLALVGVAGAMCWLLRDDVKSSAIDLRRPVSNEARRFGAVRYYYAAVVTDQEGVERPALFTLDQISTAIARAAANPEDV